MGLRRLVAMLYALVCNCFGTLKNVSTMHKKFISLGLHIPNVI